LLLCSYPRSFALLSEGGEGMRRIEEGIQRAVADYLDLCLPDHAVWFHCPNGGGRSKAEAGAFKAQGVKAGVPDILIFHRHPFPITYAIELKAPGKYLSPAQKDMKAQLEGCGVVYGPVCRSVDDVKAFLKPLLPMRHTRS